MKITGETIKKTISYGKRNGFMEAVYAAVEKIRPGENDKYTYVPVPEEILEKQRKKEWKRKYRFSILVPAYHSKEQYLRELMDSVTAQTYDKWELIIADAGDNDVVKNTMDEYLAEHPEESRILYLKLDDNYGIAGNTNKIMDYAAGEYIGLLDHDDLLTPDCLYTVMEHLETADTEPVMLYSDEDKLEDATGRYYCPHYKQQFNFDLILSNNWICHFMVMKADWIRMLRMRPEYDGAQDYDLVLRCISSLENANLLVHLSKVLYHWRSYPESTAENTESKQYAYEAGRRAVQDFCTTHGWNADVVSSKHLGFYEIHYVDGIFAQRPDVGIIGGPIYSSLGKITDGAMDEEGKVIYEGLFRHDSGYMHRAGMNQDVAAVSIKNMDVREELQPLYEEVFGKAFVKGQKDFVGMDFDSFKTKSVEFCARAAEYGYRTVYIPTMTGE